MPNAEKPKNNDIKLQTSRAVRDLVLLIAVTILVFILAYFFDMFILIVKFLQEHPNRIIYIDEVVTVLLTLSAGLTIFAWRRWLELKKETAERIRKQEELLKLTATQAEVEKIVGKQIRCDMDQMKQDVREILHLLLNKHKKAD